MIALQLLTGAAAVAGGTLLAIKPDGSLLGRSGRPCRAVRSGTVVLPASSWPCWSEAAGLSAAVEMLLGRRDSRLLSGLFGLGLVIFELFELAWTGFQPLEVVFSAVGVTVTWRGWQATGTV